MTDKADNAAVRSPCIRHCCLDQEDVCLGCGRTLAEILGWHSADETTRLAILQRCQARRQQRKWQPHDHEGQ